MCIRDSAKTLQQNENYVIQQVRDRFAGMEYVESWGELKNGCYFLIRTPLESIRESVSISNKFYFYVGILIIVVSGFVIWFVTKRITRPISELTLLSTKDVYKRQIVTDPTTAGIGDSKQALTYETPKKEDTV